MTMVVNHDGHDEEEYVELKRGLQLFLENVWILIDMTKMIKEDDNDIRTCHDNDNDDDKYFDDDYDLTCPSRAFQGTVCAPLYKIFAQFFLRKEIVCAPI